jgi:hypothetical protein
MSSTRRQAREAGVYLVLHSRHQMPLLNEVFRDLQASQAKAYTFPLTEQQAGNKIHVAGSAPLWPMNSHGMNQSSSRCSVRRDSTPSRAPFMWASLRRDVSGRRRPEHIGRGLDRARAGVIGGAPLSAARPDPAARHCSAPGLTGPAAAGLRLLPACGSVGSRVWQKTSAEASIDRTDRSRCDSGARRPGKSVGCRRMSRTQTVPR